MKKFYMLLLVILAGFSFLQAQNYQTFYSDRIAYFSGENGNAKCIRIDSISVDVDSIFYPFHNIQLLYDDCFTPYGNSWIGEKIVIDTNGYNFFFNKDHDTIKIKTDALLNESWTAYQLPESITVIANVTRYDTSGLLGQIDSIKTIEFKVYDESMDLITHQLNDMTLELSKNYGITKTFNFYLFPDYYVYIYPFEDQFEEYELVGLSKPKIGIQNLTWFGVYDFQPGDEIHVLYKDKCNSGPEGYYSNTTKTIQKFLSKIEYSDSIVYRIDKKQSSLTTTNDTSFFNYLHDSLNAVIVRNADFNKLPDEPVIAIDGYEAYTYRMEYDDRLRKIKPYSYETLIYSNDSCWLGLVADGCDAEFEYIEGLGGPYYWCVNNFSCMDAGTENTLVYYKKGDETWGTPLVVTGIDQEVLNNEIEVFPNPTNDILNIKTTPDKLPFRLEIIDLSGRVLISKEIRTDSYSMSLDENLKGIFIYTISNHNLIKTGKLIIE